MTQYKTQSEAGNAGRVTPLPASRSPLPIPGFTLVELMIAVVIMVLMMLAFGMIVTEAQKVVTVTQNKSRGNNTADAIARTIRNDLQKITKNGFLCITRKWDGGTPDPNASPVLLFTTTGINRSKVSSTMGLGGISCYGYVTNAASSSQPFLFRQAWILNSTDPGDDVWASDFSTFQSSDRTAIDGYVSSLVVNMKNMDDIISIPPITLSDVNNCWRILSANTRNLYFQWTNGTTDAGGNLNWYGVWLGADTSKPTQYRAKGKNADNTPGDDWQANDLASGETEYEWISGSTHSYRALWTHENQNNWPKAIKVKFTIRDEELLNASGDSTTAGTVYEVIVPIN